MRKCGKELFCAWALLAAGNAWGQARVGNGLNGAYYAGREFEKLVASRRDATIDFDWHETRPVAGLGATDFSVRWTGWLVPPATGRYVLHISVDDGIRLWLNDRLLLDDWRGQGLSYYQVEADLRAGEPYALRIEYCQYALATRARLAWRVPTPAPDRPGATPGLTEPTVIPARYLFSRYPDTTATKQPARRASLPAQPAPLVAAAPRDGAPTKAALVPTPAPASLKPRPVSYLRPPASAAAPAPTATPSPVAAPAPAPHDEVSASSAAALASQLASGRALTLRTLYFEQGQAELLPQVQASLDTLAQALRSQPTRRFEVQGHTDNQGDPAINQLLSRRRAEAVCQYLAAHGVVASRLRAVGYGGSRPVADNSQPAQRPRNRRVVLLPIGK